LPLPHYKYTQQRLQELGVESADAAVPRYTTAEELDREMQFATGFLGGSRLVAASIAEWADKPMIIHPPGVDGLPTIDVPPSANLGPVRLLYVGRFSPQKGVRYLFDALRGVVQHTNRAWELTMISADAVALRAEVDRVCPGLPIHVKDAMPRGDVLDQMRSHDIFVLPSLYEGFALVLAEALASGMAVVATSMTGAADLQIDGVCGRVVEAARADQLEKSIIDVIDDDELRARFRSHSRGIAAGLTWPNYQRDVAPQVETFFA
jgi:glycosyltransferase involved in cell wall biosynthesis